MMFHVLVPVEFFGFGFSAELLLETLRKKGGAKGKGKRVLDAQRETEEKVSEKDTPWKEQGSSSNINKKGNEKGRWKKKRRKRKSYGGDFVDLVIRHSDLYLLGFVYQRNFYKLKEMENDTELPTPKELEEYEVVPLSFSGSYKGLGVSFEENLIVGVPAIEQMFQTLTRCEYLINNRQFFLKKNNSQGRDSPQAGYR
jgi:hypothetical protein